MTRYLAAVALIAGVARAVPAALTPRAAEQPGRPTRSAARFDWQAECTAARERATVAKTARRRALGAGRISTTELDPSALDALRALAYQAGACNGDDDPVDAHVQVTTRLAANRLWNVWMPNSDHPAFLVTVHGRFDEPGFRVAANATYIDVVYDALTLFATDYGSGTRAPDTSALGPATPLIP